MTEDEIRLDERVKVLDVLLALPCQCERAKLAKFFRLIEKMKFEAECKLNGYEE